MWVITGDGDGLSIGGNHLMHAIRRNLDINIVLFNNRIYGLTKGQYSPTSPLGKKTKSTPMGAIDNPLHPLSIAIGCEATFVARSIDVQHQAPGRSAQAGRPSTKGTAFVEVYQNCNVFNDGAWDYATDSETKADTIVELEHGKPLIFGKNRDKGIRLNGMEPEVVELGKGITEDDLLFHDEKAAEPSLAYLLSRMRHEDGFPEPIGVFRAVEAAEVRRGAERADRSGPSEARRRRSERSVQLRRNLGGDMIICPYCSSENIEGVDLCDDCGQPLSDSHLAPPSNEVEQGLLQDRVSVLAPKPPLTVKPDTPVAEVLKLMVEQKIGCVIVADGPKPLGIFSERDALRKLNVNAAAFGSRPVSEFMTPNPQTLVANAKIAYAVQRMDLGGYRHLPVVETTANCSASSPPATSSTI